MDLDYIRKVNGMYGKSSLIDSEISEIVNNYNEAKENLITKFIVAINSTDAVDVKINDVQAKCLIENTISKDDVTEEKRIIKTRLTTPLNRGNLVFYDNNYFMVLSDVDKEKDHKRATLSKCNQTINFKGLPQPMWCVADDTAYFTKGSVQGDYFIENDAKLKIYLPRNEYTEKIYVGMRFIFEHEYCYEVTQESTLVLKELVSLTLARSSTQAEDDKANNIAFNPELDKIIPDKTPAFAEIQGENEIKIGQEYKFFITGATEWAIDDTEIAEIVRIEDSACFIIGKKVNWINISAKVGNKNYTKSVVVRR